MLFSFSCASFTVLPKSLSLTLNKTVPRSMAFSELIIGGPSEILYQPQPKAERARNSWFEPGMRFMASRLFRKS